MAVRIPRSELSSNQIDTIIKYLILQPKETYYNKNHYGSVSKDPIQFFEIDPLSKEVTVPYAFYRGLTQKQPNYDRKYPNVPYNFIGSLFEVQIPIAENALNQLVQYGTTTLNLHTASGKTVISAYLSANFNMLTLILYKSSTLELQWKKTFEEFTDARIWIVGENPPLTGAHVILCMDTRFNKLPKDYLEMIGTVIIDEAHEFCTPSRVICLLGTQPRYVISATATLERKNGMHLMIQAICGMHSVMKISRKPFAVYKFITGIDIPIVVNKQGTPDWTKFCHTQSTDETRNIMILDIIRKNPTFKILVLTWRADHVDLLYDCLIKMNISVDKMSRNKKKYSDSQVLVGTIAKIGTGFDERTACDDFHGFCINLLLLTVTMKSIQLLEQVAGRCFRTDFPQIIYFVDNTKISENHWKEAQKWFKSRNGTIYEMISDHAALGEKTKIPDHVGLASAQLDRIHSNGSIEQTIPTMVNKNPHQIQIVPSVAPHLSVIQSNKDQIPNQTSSQISDRSQSSSPQSLIQAQLARLNITST